MGRRRAGSHQCGANRALFFGKLLLQTVQGGKEGFEWASAEQLAGRFTFVALEGFQAGLLIDPFGFIGKQHGIAVEGDTQFIAGRPPCAARKNGRSTEACA